MIKRRGVEAIEVIIVLAMIGVFLAIVIPAIGAAMKHNGGTWVKDSDGYDRKVVTIEDCEYVVIQNGAAHKGNCKACLKRQGFLKAERDK